MKFTTTADIGHDIRRYINDEVERAGGTWSAATIAIQVIDRLRVEDPVLLAKWLDLIAVDVMRREIVSISHQFRAEAARNSHPVTRSRSVFQGAIQRYEEGNKEALGAWLDSDFVVNGHNLRKHLRDMDQEDLAYAIADFTNRSRTNAMKAAFLRAVAEKVGARTVGEVFSDEDLSRLWRSLE